jgi:tetratricopeptide (TPR) repeat protein
VIAALATPLPLSALPIRVATFSLKGPEPDKLQLLIHADVGTDYANSQIVSLAYTISDPNGRIVDSQGASARLPPIMVGVPSALQFAGGASLPPGDYSLKLAIAEGDRVGTVEHSMHVALAPVGRVQFSDLMVGGSANPDPEPLQPTVGYTVVFGSVHGYLEAYGRDVAGLKAQFEIAKDADGEPILQEEVATKTAGDTRAIFTRQMPVRQLPPGSYVLRVKVSSDGTALKTMTREFEVAAPRVLMTSAASSTIVPPTDIFLPALETQLSRPFDRTEAAQASTVQAFRARVPESAVPAFDKGVALLTAGEFSRAEETFKRAIDPDIDSTALMAYLAAVYAAAGHDRDAAGAWQTALIEGSDIPEIYVWLGDALLRAGDVSQARAILEEATQKWPTDPRFTRPAALAFAMFGQGREAMRALERYLEQRPADIEANYMAVEWLYNLHSAGSVAHSRDEDRKLARRYAEAYEKAKGPQTALVKQWLEFLER